MKSWNEVEAWDVVSKKAYWDRDVPLDKWKEKTSLGHRSYLPDAVAHFDVTEFVKFYGIEAFIQDWPRLRAMLPEPIAGRAGMYDIAWSKLVCDGWNLRPYEDYYDLPERRREFLTAACARPGQSIYAIAKALGMQYRRAHDHATALIEEGRLRAAERIENGHRKKKLYPAYGRPLSATQKNE